MITDPIFFEFIFPVWLI